ncbi:MAG: signal recognition particle-docking protein FtsY [Candidatus Woesearchaeota archaeon]
MFGKLKDKLKSALSVFSKKAEEEAEVKQIIVETTPPQKREVKPEAVKKEEPIKIIEEVKQEFKKEAQQKERKKFQEKLAKDKKEEEKKEELLQEKAKIESEIVEEAKEIKEELKGIPEDQVKITYFVHGTTTDNEKGVSSGWYDVELSELGVKQSVELWNKVKDKHFDIVFCSDLKRAVHSAELTFKGKVKIISDPKLRECNYGKYNANPSEIVEPMQEKNITVPFPEGESYEDIKKRITEFLNYVYDNYRGKHVGIVAHKAPQLALDVLLNNKTWEQAFAEDWRKRKAWQPGWDYYITKHLELPKEEKKGFFSKLFHKHEEPKEEKVESFTEVPIPEKYNPATQKFEPDLEKIKEISEKEEKQEDKKEKIKEREEVEEKKGFFGKVKQTLTTKTISEDKFEDLFWGLEVALLENNVSVEVIEKIKQDLKLELVDKPLPRDVETVIGETLKRTLQEILSVKKINLLELIKKKKPYVIAFFGVNGAGKTTSIAKLTYYLQQHGLSVVLAACDTFRAAAIQQLEEHADRLKVKMIKHDYGSDAAAVAYDAVKYADKNKIDVVLIDTAGRLHSNTNLMQELEKIIRIAKPHLKLFVGESITGNDCIEQAREFNSLVEMDGAILTKADVDEKGGAPLSIAYTIKKPILFLGMGQEYKDLEEFNAEKILERLGL